MCSILNNHESLYYHGKILLLLITTIGQLMDDEMTSCLKGYFCLIEENIMNYEIILDIYIFELRSDNLMNENCHETQFYYFVCSANLFVQFIMKIYFSKDQCTEMTIFEFMLKMPSFVVCNILSTYTDKHNMI